MEMEVEIQKFRRDLSVVTIFLQKIETGQKASRVHECINKDLVWFL